MADGARGGDPGLHADGDRLLVTQWAAGVALFLKARRFGPLCAVLILLAVVVWLVGGHMFLIGDHTPTPVPWAAVAPCVTAYAIAATALPELAWLDGLAARRMAGLRVAYLAAVSIGNGLLLWGATAGLHQEQLGSVAALRNYVGCLGISIGAVTVAGAELGWIAPLLALFAAIFGASSAPRLEIISWMAKPDDDGTAVGVAIGWLALGAVLMTLRGLRLRLVGVPG